MNANPSKPAAARADCVKLLRNGVIAFHESLPDRMKLEAGASFDVRVGDDPIVISPEKA